MKNLLINLSTESPRQRSLFDRPPTRSGGNSEQSEKLAEPAAPKKTEAAQKQTPKPGMKMGLVSLEESFDCFPIFCWACDGVLVVLIIVLR